MKTRALLPLLLLLAVGHPAAAQAPLRTEQFVYSILAFNGKDYSGTFTREGSDAVYLLAGEDNFLTARKAFVYWWPLTSEWKVDTSVLNEEVAGKVEVEGPGVPRQELAKASFTYFNQKGEYELNWRVAKGDQAKQAYALFMTQQDDQLKARNAFEEAQAAHEKKINDLTNQILAMRQRGLEPAALVAQIQGLKAPEEPKAQSDFVVPPREPQEAYDINLPVGEYRIRFVLADGAIMEGSERKLVIFQKRRAGAAGYEVIPADKWTRPEQSTEPGSVLYVNGQTDIYLRPFFQDEFNDLAYEKLLRNDARGNPNLSKWVKMQQIPKATIEVSARGQAMLKTTEMPYKVEQLPGSSLGYKIVPFQPKPGQTEVDLFAYKVPIARDRPVLRLDVRDNSGKLVPVSQRQIRVVAQPQGLTTLLILAIAPLLVMGLVMAFRAARLKE